MPNSYIFYIPLVSYYLIFCTFSSYYLFSNTFSYFLRPPLLVAYFMCSELAKCGPAGCAQVHIAVRRCPSRFWRILIPEINLILSALCESVLLNMSREFSFFIYFLLSHQFCSFPVCRDRIQWFGLKDCRPLILFIFNLSQFLYCFLNKIVDRFLICSLLNYPNTNLICWQWCLKYWIFSENFAQ